MKVSIITVSYNSHLTIEDTIQSVVNQTYKNIEYIIIDGASTDGTIDVIKKYLNYISHFTSEKDAGIYDAINKGIKASTGDIIGILNSDDILQDVFVIEKVVHSFQQQEIDALYGNLIYVKKSNTNQIIRNWVSGIYQEGKFLKGWMPPHPTFYVKRSIYDQYGTYNASFRISADYELMLRMIHKHKIKVFYLPLIMIKMRVGGESNQSFISRIKANREDRKAWRINNLKPKPFTFILKPLSKIKQFFKTDQ